MKKIFYTVTIIIGLSIGYFTNIKNVNATSPVKGLEGVNITTKTEFRRAEYETTHEGYVLKACPVYYESFHFCKVEVTKIVRHFRK